MGNRILTIEIGLQETKICEIECIPAIQKYLVRKCSIVETPENTVEDGYIRDKETFTRKMKEEMKKQKINGKKVIFSVASSKIYTKEIIVPRMPESKIKAVIQTNISEYLPFDMSDYVLEHIVLEKISAKEEKKIRVLLLAMPDNMIKNYYSVAEMLGLTVASIDYSGNSIYQVLRMIPRKGTNVYIQVNAQSTMVTVLKDRCMVLQRGLGTGTVSMAQAMMDSEPSQIRTEREAFERLKNIDFCQGGAKVSEIQEYDNAGVNQTFESEYAIHAVKEAVDYLVSSIGRVMDYYVNREGGKTIDHVYFLGEGLQIKGLHEHLQKELGINISLIEGIDHFSGGKNASDYLENPSSYVSVLGSAIHPIGFRPKAVLVKEKKKSELVGSAAIIGLCLGASVILYWNAKSSYSEANQELKEAQEELAQLPVTVDEQSKLEETTDKLDQIYELYEETINYNDYLYEVIETLEDTLVEEVEVKSMQITTDDILFSVEMNSNDTAAKLVQQLESLDNIFSKVTISGYTETTDDTGLKTITYSITCKYAKIMRFESGN